MGYGISGSVYHRFSSLHGSLQSGAHSSLLNVCSYDNRVSNTLWFHLKPPLVKVMGIGKSIHG